MRLLVVVLVSLVLVYADFTALSNPGSSVPAAFKVTDKSMDTSKLGVMKAVVPQACTFCSTTTQCPNYFSKSYGNSMLVSLTTPCSGTYGYAYINSYFLYVTSGQVTARLQDDPNSNLVYTSYSTLTNQVTTCMYFPTIGITSTLSNYGLTIGCQSASGCTYWLGISTTCATSNGIVQPSGSSSTSTTSSGGSTTTTSTTSSTSSSGGSTSSSTSSTSSGGTTTSSTSSGGTTTSSTSSTSSSGGSTSTGCAAVYSDSSCSSLKRSFTSCEVKGLCTTIGSSSADLYTGWSSTGSAVATMSGNSVTWSYDPTGACPVSASAMTATLNMGVCTKVPGSTVYIKFNYVTASSAAGKSFAALSMLIVGVIAFIAGRLNF